MLQRAIMLAALSSLTHHLFADTEQVKVYFDRQDLSTIQDPGCGAKSQDLLSVDDVFKQSLPQRLKYLNDYQKCIPQWYGADIKDMQLLPKVKGWSLVHDPIKRTSTYTHEKGDTAIPHVVNAIQSSSSSIGSLLYSETSKAAGDRYKLAKEHRDNKKQYTACGDVTQQDGHGISVAPVTLANIYDYPENLGKGNVVAILSDGSAGDAAYSEKALNTFIQTQYHTQNIPNIKLTKHHQQNEANGEADLDLSIIASIAPNADIIMIAAKDTSEDHYNLYDIFEEAIHYGRNDQKEQKPVNIISSSYYDPMFFLDNWDKWPEKPPKINTKRLHRFELLMEDAALRNITVVSASGDSGSAGINRSGKLGYVPATSAPYMLSVGGTSFSDALIEALNNQESVKTLQTVFKTHQNEVWNENYCDKTDNTIDGSYSFESNQSSSGGVTLGYQKPFYQDYHNINQGPYRSYPDISMLAGGSAYFQILSGFSGGTSASAPLIAGLIARINTEIQKETNKPFSIGFINPIIYQA